MMTLLAARKQAAKEAWLAWLQLSAGELLQISLHHQVSPWLLVQVASIVTI